MKIIILRKEVFLLEKPLIQIKNVDKFFGRIQVLKQVSADFRKGNIYGFIGRNGSGKTVLFKCICGFIPVTSGHIFISEKEIWKETDMPIHAGIMLETPGFLPNYSGYKNLEFLYNLKNKKNPKRIKEVMQKVGLEPENHKWVRKYSLGMRQRLVIAQAFMENQQLLILDEPMNGLDNQGVKDIRKLFLELKEQGKTILIASHNREYIEILCDEVYEMDAGVLIKK